MWPKKWCCALHRREDTTDVRLSFEYDAHHRYSLNGIWQMDRDVSFRGLNELGFEKSARAAGVVWVVGTRTRIPVDAVLTHDVSGGCGGWASSEM